MVRPLPLAHASEVLSCKARQRLLWPSRCSPRQRCVYSVQSHGKSGTRIMAAGLWGDMPRLCVSSVPPKRRKAYHIPIWTPMACSHILSFKATALPPSETQKLPCAAGLRCAKHRTEAQTTPRQQWRQVGGTAYLIKVEVDKVLGLVRDCLLYTSPSPRD